MEYINKNIIVYRNNYVPDTVFERFQKTVEQKYDMKFDSYMDFHKWSVENFTEFWEETWHFFDVKSSEPYKQVFRKTGPGFIDSEWFGGAKLNYAENLLRIRDERTALIYLDELGNEETVTFAQMFEEVKLYAAAFKKNGLKIGDTVAGFMSNRKEAVFAALAVASIGALWGGPVPFYGARAASNIVSKLEPKFLISIDGFQDDGVIFPLLDYLPEIVNNAPSIQKVILIATKEETRKKDLSNIKNCVYLEDFLEEGVAADGKVPDIVFEQLPFDHPLHVNFTSGTTGLPKAAVHSGGVFLPLMRDYAIYYDIKCGDVVSQNYQMGWSMWEYAIPCLALGATMVLYCSSVYHNHNGKNFWDIMAKYKVKFTTLVTSMVDKMEKIGLEPSPDSNLHNLKVIEIGCTPVKRENFEYLRIVKENVYVANMYGTTEVFGYFSGFCFNMPVYAGEIQVPALGMDIQCFDSEGKSVINQRGELVVRNQSPCFPIGLWKDEDKRRLTDIYLSKYPGVWCVHDQGWFNPKTNGFVVIGRSDDTLKQKGDRFGSGDIYFAIHSLKELQDYICVGQVKDNGDNRAVLFVKMQPGYKLTPELKRKIEKKVNDELWEDCVPELILEVPDIPYNLNNKRLESVVRKIVQSNEIPDVTNIRNPESLKYFANIPEVVNYNQL